MLRRIGQQLAATGFTHGDAGRHLMPRGHVIIVTGCVVEDNALLIDRVRHNLAFAEHEGIDGLAKTGILNADASMA